jgi:hypothetical protein
MTVKSTMQQYLWRDGSVIIVHRTIPRRTAHSINGLLAAVTVWLWRQRLTSSQIVCIENRLRPVTVRSRYGIRSKVGGVLPVCSRGATTSIRNIALQHYSAFVTPGRLACVRNMGNDGEACCHHTVHHVVLAVY